MNAKSTICRTILLDDAPATEDAFGPHKRVADAIVSLVTSEPGGRAIGVEGGWGSGKSTVVGFVRNALKTNDDFRVITFDAWAHEGDPLRRTYLETVIGDLKEANWLNPETWDNTLDELANRRKTTTTRITPKPTRLGAIFAISLVLVPIGTALITATFRQAASGDVTDLRTWPWIAWTGAAIAMSPFWVLLGNAIRIVGRGLWRAFRALVRWPSSTQGAQSDWSFLLSKAIEETKTDSTETPNPTSIEFEEYFTRAMKEALDADDTRRLVLVLDNLDRVDANSAIGVWSTLQTFLQERNSLNSTWFKQVWVVVPYDPIGLRKLWDNWTASPVVGNGDKGGTAKRAKDERVASDSFIDKSFQIRFQVPPPVLSDWKTYLCNLLEKALPDHNETDRHALYRVYEEWRSSQSVPPTPRELKLYVNQIGAIHRQWQHEFPIAHVAYYVLHSRQSDSLMEQLKSNDFPPANVKRLLKDDLIPSLAGLAFNVPPSKGMEFLLSDPIYNCLTNGTAKELVELSEKHQAGFWAVIEGVVATRIHEASGAVIAQAGRRLFEAGLLTRDETQEAQAIRSAFRDSVASVQDWQPLDTDTAEGIAAIHRLFNDHDLSANVMKTVASTVTQSKVADKKQDLSSAPTALLVVLGAVTDLGFDDVIPQSIVIPGDVDAWMAACEALTTDVANERFWKHLKSKEKVDAIASAIQTAIGAGEFSDRHIGTLRVTTSGVTKTDWGTVASAIQSRLDVGVGASADEMRQLLRGLWVLRNLGDGKSSKALKALVSGGHIAHHLHQAAKHKEGAALCHFTILNEDPTAATPPAVGNSASGHQSLTNALAASDKETATALCDAFRKYSKISALLGIMDARGSCDPLLATCMKCIAESDAPQELFTGEVVLNRWEKIQQALSTGDDDRPFDQLVGKLADVNKLCDAIQSAEKGFVPDDAVLYWTIVRTAKNEHSGFYNWCKDGLERLDKEAWLADLSATDECVWLACMLADKGIKVKLTTHFSDALADHAAEIVKGNQIPEDAVIKRWQEVLSLLEESTRKALLPRLLTVAIGADGQLSKGFLTMYGGDIGNPEVLTTNNRSVEGLFSPIVRERNIPGVSWLIGFFKDNGRFLDSLTAKFNAGEFRTRLQDCVNNPELDDAQPLIEELATILGIEAAKPESEAEAQAAE